MRHDMSFHSCEKEISKYLSAALKFAKTQNEPKGAETKQCHPQLATMSHDQFSLTMFPTKQILTIPLFRKRLYLLGHFKDEFLFLSNYKSSR